MAQQRATRVAVEAEAGAAMKVVAVAQDAQSKVEARLGALEAEAREHQLQRNAAELTAREAAIALAQLMQLQPPPTSGMSTHTGGLARDQADAAVVGHRSPREDCHLWGLPSHQGAQEGRPRHNEQPQLDCPVNCNPNSDSSDHTLREMARRPSHLQVPTVSPTPGPASMVAMLDVAEQANNAVAAASALFPSPG